MSPFAVMVPFSLYFNVKICESRNDTIFTGDGVVIDIFLGE